MVYAEHYKHVTKTVSISRIKTHTLSISDVTRPLSIFDLYPQCTFLGFEMLRAVAATIPVLISSREALLVTDLQPFAQSGAKNTRGTSRGESDERSLAVWGAIKALVAAARCCQPTLPG